MRCSDCSLVTLKKKACMFTDSLCLCTYVLCVLRKVKFRGTVVATAKLRLETFKNMKNSNRANVSLLMHGTMLMFASSYLFVLVNPLNSIIRTIYNGTYMKRNGVAMSESTWAVYLSLTSSFFIIGGLVGGLGMQFILKITSRKRLMQLAHLNNILSVILIAGVGKITESYEVFIVGRFIGGICFGLSFNLPSLMVSETSVKQKQNFWQSIISVSGCCGFLFAVVMGNDKVLGSLTLWPVAFSIGSLPSIVYLITSLYLPDTPYDILHRLGTPEALDLLRTLRNGSEEDIHEEFELLQPDTELTRKIGIIDILSIKQYRNQFIAVNILLCNIVMGGIDTILLYSSVIFINVGISEGNMIFINIGAYSLLVLSSVVCTILVNKFGGYRVLFVGTIVLIFSQVLFTISQALTHLAPTVMPTLAVVSIFIYLAAWSAGINGSVFAVLAEITTDENRTAMYGYAAVSFWIFTWLGTFVPPYLLLGYQAYAVTPWLVWTVLMLLYIIFCLPDTRGKKSEDIQTQFSQGFFISGCLAP